MSVDAVTGMVAGGGVSLVAHGVHYAVLAAGLAGLVALLLPQLLESRAPADAPPRDEHEARVRELRTEMQRYAGGSTTVAVRPRTGAHRVAEPRTVEGSVLLPLAVVGSVAAAVVHAAVCPDHFHEKFVFGLFFAVCATVQVGWAFMVARAATPSLLMVGALGNFLVVGLWTVSRVEGLPFGLLPEPEEVGTWDVAACAWEVVVVVACVLLVRRGIARVRLAPFARWHRGVQALTLVSAAVLVALSLIGASS